MLAARAKPGPCKPWFDRIDTSKLDKDDILSVGEDDKGRTWMLFRSVILGNRDDLFIAEKKGSKWGRPLFTGATTDFPRRNPFARLISRQPEQKYTSTEWIHRYPDTTQRSALDSDGDGLTDLVEARLGTDPHNPDTDGDGLPDAVDPCPNAAPRPLGDTEKIVAACIEAWFFQENSPAPAMVYVDNVQPFELFGYPSILMWPRPEGGSPLYSTVDRGMVVITFEPSSQPGGFISYSADHKSAHTVMHYYTGGSSGEKDEVTLKKIGDDWFVVDIQVRSVS